MMMLSKNTVTYEIVTVKGENINFYDFQEGSGCPGVWLGSLPRWN